MRFNKTPLLLALMAALGSVTAPVLRAADPLGGSETNYSFKLDSKASLLRIGATPMNVTKEGREAAQTVLDAIAKNDVALAEQAIDRYDHLIPKENLGGDYTAMQWLCRDLIARLKGQTPQYNRLETAYRNFFTSDNYANLKEYFRLKYMLLDFDPKTITSEQKERRGLLEDYLMFMNPCREEWESSEECLALLRLKPGEKVLDIGCGIGYYTYKMAKQVGPEGQVYAIDTNEKFVQEINDFIKAEKIENVTPVVSQPTDIKVSDQADVAFICSLYHVIYGWSTEPSRRAFLESIKRALKPTGRLVIVDNLAGDGRELHSCYVDRRLVAAQLYFYGFRVEYYAEISPLRYMLVLRQARPGDRPALLPLLDAEQTETNHDWIHVTSGNSLVHIGSLDSYDITPGGIAAAKLVLEALEQKNPDAAQQAIDRYNGLIPNENFGGEFTALQWFCQHLLASPEQKDVMLKDPLVRAYYHYLADDDYALLKDYVKFKYKLNRPGEKSLLSDEPEVPRPPKKEEAPGKEAPAQTGAKTDARSQAIRPKDEAADPSIGRTRRTFIEDFILFNNPRRPEWENTDKIMSLLDFKKGDKIADVGCGSGFYSFRFAQRVGRGGRVYAMDIKKEHLEFIKEYAKKQGIKNVVTVQSTEDDLSLKEPVDAAFMCSLYHIIYGVAPELGRDAFINSIKRALKPHGQLVIVDNGPVENSTLPYHGPYLAKELTIAQLEHYGFKFKSYHQIIPQRYLLTFEKVD